MKPSEEPSDLSASRLLCREAFFIFLLLLHARIIPLKNAALLYTGDQKEHMAKKRTSRLLPEGLFAYGGA